ncbi:hypothetical protein GCM10023258_39540 [Terrabacter aeriphilus]|uniref:Uncharacterized protein n=1 Tax=Terrabacter aeriphilus TaxID=515662 RepID=A0ABP9JQU4_9MICO
MTLTTELTGRQPLTAVFVETSKAQAFCTPGMACAGASIVAETPAATARTAPAPTARFFVRDMVEERMEDIVLALRWCRRGPDRPA